MRVQDDVYGWLGFRTEARTATNHHSQTREIVAARSKAAVGRIVGADPRSLFNLGTTGNADERATAQDRPGVVFWRPLNDHNASWTADDVA